MSATVAKDKPGRAALLAAIALSGALFCGCGGGPVVSSSLAGGGTVAPLTAMPSISTVPALKGAMIVTLIPPVPGAIILYTLDGSLPDQNSSQTITYQAPFLVASNLTVMAIATAPGDASSAALIQTFTPNISSGTLVWSDEFTNSTSGNAQPNPQTWTYDTGTDCCGNNELETYCAWGSTALGCNPLNPNAYVGTDSYLHIKAEQLTPGVYTAGNFTSARLKTRGLFSFQYGRLEARMILPESQGMWPAFWLLGNSIATVNWPACGELDVMEHINGSNPQNEGFDWVQGSIHGTKLTGGIQYHPAAFSAAAWHTYGMIWTKGQIQYYVDDSTKPYATYTPATQTGTWPFDSGPEFILLNLAVGGNWPGSPDATTVFPSEIQVDYVRVYTN